MSGPGYNVVANHVECNTVEHVGRLYSGVEGSYSTQEPRKMVSQLGHFLFQLWKHPPYGILEPPGTRFRPNQHCPIYYLVSMSSVKGQFDLFWA